MYNRSLFNVQPYNRAVASGEDIFLVLRMSERLDGWMNISADYSATLRASESISGRTLVAAGLQMQLAVKEALTGQATALVGVQVSALWQEQLKGRSHFGADIHLLHELEELLEAYLHVGADLDLLDDWLESLTGTLELGADIDVYINLYEVLNGYANVQNVVEYVTRYIGEIPPGSILVIDANNFTMLLDNMNAIQYHEGDWINVSRSTVSLTLSGIGSDQFDWEVFYIAQYL